MRDERGFSLIKFLMLLAILAGGVWYGYNVLPVYNAEWKIQDAFDAISRDMTNSSEQDIRSRLPDLFHIKYLAYNDVPKEFYDNIRIDVSNGRVNISSSYHVTVWLLGPVQSVDPNSDYAPSDLKGMDRLRAKLRLDFDFEPHAETP
ncbi:MAG TPA: DUF4845 domain-containing protein [Mariprofundaceae bacterium]|nr:DUF4845 domain-containing protein [Mariprofundaceae bacterium]